jgi:hemerythrin-like domain-containing protein
MNTTREAAPAEALDACHRQILERLGALAALARRLESSGVDAEASRQAGAIEAFFSATSRQHHADEEKTVFPPLLASSDAALVAAVRTLQQDHGWIEENWLELAPKLRAIAAGDDNADAAEFQHAVEIFLDLMQGHIALEETLIYPEFKARWAQAVERRTSR